MAQRGLSNPYQVIEEYEGKEIFSYGEKLLKDSFNTLELSLNTTGYLPVQPLGNIPVSIAGMARF